MSVRYFQFIALQSFHQLPSFLPNILSNLEDTSPLQYSAPSQLPPRWLGGTAAPRLRAAAFPVAPAAESQVAAPPAGREAVLLSILFRKCPYIEDGCLSCLRIKLKLYTNFTKKRGNVGMTH